MVVLVIKIILSVGLGIFGLILVKQAFMKHISDPD